MKNLLKQSLLAIGILAVLTPKLMAQQQVVTFNGLARGYLINSALSGNRLTGDTLTNKKNNTGHTLIDLGIQVKPNAAIQITGVIRLRNEFGGFYGSGVTTTIRQLTAKGVIGKVVKYQVGDIWLKQTPYTVWNSAEEGKVNEADAFNLQRQVVYYENYYKPGNEWRIQGGQSEAGFTFDKGIKEITIHGFGARNTSSDYVYTQPTMFTGGRVRLMQSKNLVIGGNFVSLFSLDKVSPGTALMQNNVASVNFKTEWENENVTFGFLGEAGNSSLKFTGYQPSPATPNDTTITDGFADLGVAATLKKYNLTLKANYHNVGADFYSAGAQTRRMLYTVPQPLFQSFHPAGKAAVLRQATAMDMLREPTLYNQTLTASLMSYNPLYTNVTPYGLATPNRSGFMTDLKYDGQDVELFASVNVLSELVGQGTDNKRTYQQMKVGANFPVNQWIGWKKTFKITTGYQSEATARSGENYQKVDLKTSLIDLGLNLEIAEKLVLQLGAKQIVGKGNELIAVRNTYNTITGFTPYSVNQSQSMYALGLKYNFTEWASLAIQGQSITVSDKDNSNYDYNMQSGFFLLNLQF